VTTVAALFGVLFVDSVPLHPPDQPPASWVMPAGLWTAIVLTGGLNAYFIGRTRAALRDREEQLLRARERAARNEQLAILSTLSAGAAHELGTPLGTIAVVARELEIQSRQLDEDGGLAEDARLIRQEVDRCRRILDRMRVDSIELVRHNATPIDLTELVKQVVEALKPGEESRLKVDCDPNLQTVLGPLHTLQQAVNVLVRNAFDASPQDGVVELQIRRDDGHVVFAVEDHGTGMSEETLHRAGQPFFTTKPPGQGMGLGLFLVRLVAERAGGTFRLESKPGVGTRSELHLPESPPGSPTR
jgi:two-component system sensor histidine kinase RegB